MEPILIDGQWRASAGTEGFAPDNPATRTPLPQRYPISPWADLDAALSAAASAYAQLRNCPAGQIADFMESYASLLGEHAAQICELAHLETGLPIKPRLADVELPRTINQLRLAATAARDGTWALPTIDTAAKIRSCLGSIGPVIVFGPNNFPFAYNGVAGGDFAAAIATGNPVIGKANPGHPGTTKLLAEVALSAVSRTGLPPATVQLVYRTSHADGERLVSDPRTAAIGYTGGRNAGLALKHAADNAGKPIYLELSSVNPVAILPGALQERGSAIVEEYCGSCLMGSGQFCTNPGLVLLLADPASDEFVRGVTQKFQAAQPGTLLGATVERQLHAAVQKMHAGGAKILCGGQPTGESRYAYANTLLQITGAQFLAESELFQTEAFGNAALFVMVATADEAAAVLRQLEGNLTGSLYTGMTGDFAAQDAPLYALLEPILRDKVGRLLNDKMPTGVAVSPAMNHGGPYPATGHAGFSAVGVPVSLRRFAALHCYDNVREPRLPPVLRDKNSTGQTWRLIDGNWTQGDVA
ncbi:MAG: aldehyde dehydrogenase (NADP(+)) [Pirellulales bacterium]|nr:aldehyde dehydrogenase (NADP(+)) [Pirellulales bacterium]